MTYFRLMSLNKDSEGRMLSIRAKWCGKTEGVEYFATEGGNALVVTDMCVEIDTHHGCIYKYALIDRED